MPFSSPHTAPNSKNPVQITDIKSQISEPERCIPLETATISPEDTSGRQTGPGRGAHASRHNPTPMPQASAASVIQLVSSPSQSTYPRQARRARTNGFLHAEFPDGRWPKRPIRRGSLSPQSVPISDP